MEPNPREGIEDVLAGIRELATTILEQERIEENADIISRTLIGLYDKADQVFNGRDILRILDEVDYWKAIAQSEMPPYFIEGFRRGYEAAKAGKPLPSVEELQRALPVIMGAIWAKLPENGSTS